jgi:hypothetical protein
MKYVVITLFALSLSLSSLAQTITHTVFNYEVRTTDNKGAETINIIPLKATLFYSGFCEGSQSNTMIMDLYTPKSGKPETLLFNILGKETKPAEKSTMFNAKLIDCDKTSQYYSGNETVIIMFKNNNIAIGFLNCEIYLRKYTTTVEY